MEEVDANKKKRNKENNERELLIEDLDIFKEKDSDVWYRVSISGEDFKYTVPNDKCRLVLFENDSFVKYYVDEKIKIQDSIKFLGEGSAYSQYKLKGCDTCLFFFKEKQILTLSPCNPAGSFESEHFKKVKD